MTDLTGRQHAGRRGPWRWLLGAFLIAATASFAVAQPGTRGATGDPGTLPTIQQLFAYSPYINGILLGLSVLSVLLFIGYMLTINDRGMVPADLTDQLRKLAMAKRYEQAADLCRANRGTFVASIVQRAVENPKLDHQVIMNMVDTEGRRRADVVWNRVSYLADISNVAPMLGLLGTVLGMIKAFWAVQFGRMDATYEGLTRGIAEAMATTLFGLSVGILALVFYSLVKGRATRVLADAEAAVHGIVDHMKRAS